MVFAEALFRLLLCLSDLAASQVNCGAEPSALSLQIVVAYFPMIDVLSAVVHS
jgi:hypothetical protein